MGDTVYISLGKNIIQGFRLGHGGSVNERDVFNRSREWQPILLEGLFNSFAGAHQVVTAQAGLWH